MSLSSLASSLDLFSVKLIEYKDSRLVATSGLNFGLTSPRLTAKNWRTVSVNGDVVFIVTQTGESITKSRSETGMADMDLIESVRDEIANSHGGYSHITMMDGNSMTSMGGGGANGLNMMGGTGGVSMMSSGGTGLGGQSVMMSSSSNNLGMSGISSGLSTSSMNGLGGSFSSMQSGSGGTAFDIRGMSVNMRDEQNFSVSKLGFPFMWSRIFFNGDLITVIKKNGDVIMAPISGFEPSQAEFLLNLKVEVKEIQKTQAQQFQNTMTHAQGMVSNIFNSILGQLPTAGGMGGMGGMGMGNMFGAGFPFSGGAGAVAIAGRRR